MRGLEVLAIAINLVCYQDFQHLRFCDFVLTYAINVLLFTDSSEMHVLSLVVRYGSITNVV